MTVSKRDPEATRARILESAVEEFSEHGLAGARIDRIADAAGANKRSIYVYFGNKEVLFVAALHAVVEDLTEAVPITEDDLSGYAGRLFDHLLANPQPLRMHLWRQLERPDAGPDATEVFAEKITAMSDGRGRRPGAIGPADLLILVIGLAQTWSLTANDILHADGRDPKSKKRIAAHRAAVVEAARRLSDPDLAG